MREREGTCCRWGKTKIKVAFQRLADFSKQHCPLLEYVHKDLDSSW